MTHQPSILDVIRDWFSEFMADSWAPWRAYLATVFGLPLQEPLLALYRASTGREKPPGGPAREVWTIAGRRAGKSRIAALLGVYLALFRRYELARGERGVVMILAADRRQARVIFRYVEGLIDGVPELAAKVKRRTAEAIEFDNGIAIEIHTSSFRSVRGYTVVAAILDEIAFWPTGDDSADPDREVLNALRPAMSTVPGALLVAISSPYARTGELFNAHEKHWGREGDVVAWQADTRTMNSSIDVAIIERAYDDDPSVAAAEWGAQFRADLESFVSREVVEQVTVPGRVEQAPIEGTSYVAFVDPAGGSGRDSMTLAISHAEQRDEQAFAVLDAIREFRPPFSPEATVSECVELLKGYGIDRVMGDRFGGDWPREQFRKLGIQYVPAERTKSQIYGELLPLLNSGRCELLEHDRLKAQLLGLERRTARGGRDVIDHRPNSHDDVINSAAGALVEAVRLADREPLRVWGGSNYVDPEDDYDPSEWLRRRVRETGSYFPNAD